MCHWIVFQASLKSRWTNIFAIMRVCHMTQKLCTAVIREPKGHFIRKTRRFTWTSRLMGGQFNSKHTHTDTHTPTSTPTHTPFLAEILLICSENLDPLSALCHSFLEKKRLSNMYQCSLKFQKCRCYYVI